MTIEETEKYDKFGEAIIRIIKASIRDVKELDTSYDICTSVLLDIIVKDINDIQH